MDRFMDHYRFEIQNHGTMQTESKKESAKILSRIIHSRKVK